jgi:hypothetical protein
MPATVLRSIVAVAASLTLVCSASAGEETWPAHFDFEGPESTGAWCTTAPEGSVTITRNLENVRSGTGALQLEWVATDGRLAMLSASPIQLDGRARSVRLSVKVNEHSPVMYGVREADGSSYQGYMYARAGMWHDLAVDLDELMLSEGSEDENGRLDVNEIDGIVVADLSNLGGEAGKSLGIKSGRQYLWLDDVELSERLAPHRSVRGPDGAVIIDDFTRPPIRCLPIGGPRLELVSTRDGDDTSALRVGYDRSGYRWVGFVGAMGYLDLTDRTCICLRVRAAAPAPLIVVLEERDGSKYQVRHQLDPAKGWYSLELPFSQFKLDRQTTDENGRLDLDQLRVIIPVLDTKRAEPGDDGQGAWCVGRVWAGRE